MQRGLEQPEGLTADELSGDAAFASPLAIGGHRVQRAIGAGGMGRVFLCHDDALDRPVAIKVLLPELLEQEEMRTRFLREARALARVTSPHVVAVHTVGEDPIVGPFVVMEYLEGEDLHVRLMRKGRLPWREAVQVARDAVQGLMAAQAAGIVHRDIKPANLFVVGGKAKLTDFGLARELSGSAGVTAVGLVVGTPAYLAPEVIRGGSATHQSDLYSLAATLHHLVAGEPPFVATAPLEVIAQAVNDDPPPLSRLVAGVPVALERCVLRGLAKAPDARQPHWAAFDDELRAATDDAPATPLPPPSSPPGAQPWSGAGRTLSLGSLPPNTPAADAPAQAAAATPVARAASLLAFDDEPPRLPRTPAPSLSSLLPEISSPRSAPRDGPRIKTVTLTVMMTDIAGYTERTSRVSREESARWLELHDSLLQPLFRSYGGRVVKTLGDAFLVTFPSPTDAVLCACAVQDRLWLHNQQEQAEDAIHVRVALSAGEVRLHKGDVFGEPVNLAARLEAVAEPGEVLLSDAVYATMNTSEVKLASRGAMTLKGIGRPLIVYAAVPDGGPGEPPFAGRALARVTSLSRYEGGTRALAAVSRAVGSIGAGLSESRRALMAATAAAVLLGAVLFAVWASGDDRLSRIDNGQAQAVLDEIEKVPEESRSLDDIALLGHARLALDQPERAFAAFKQAASKGHHDGRMKEAAFRALQTKDDDGAVALLVAWPEASVNKELQDLLEGDLWWPRHHAFAIMDARKALTDEGRITVGMLDIAADSCNERRAGVLLLRKVGVGNDVVKALKRLGAEPLRNACLLLELPNAEEAVEKRTSEAP